MTRPRFYDVYVRRPGSRWRSVGTSHRLWGADFIRSIFEEMEIPVKVLPVRSRPTLIPARFLTLTQSA